MAKKAVPGRIAHRRPDVTPVQSPAASMKQGVRPTRGPVPTTVGASFHQPGRQAHGGISPGHVPHMRSSMKQG